MGSLASGLSSTQGAFQDQAQTNTAAFPGGLKNIQENVEKNLSDI